MAYETTSVAVEKSQGDIRKLLADFGADQFQFGEGTKPNRWAGVTFRHDSHVVLIRVDLKEPDEKLLKAKADRARTRTLRDFRNEHWDQEARRIWRVLYWSLKARMVAVEEGVETFEQAFLAHLQNPTTGLTLWQHIQPAIDQGAFRIGGAGLAALTAKAD